MKCRRVFKEHLRGRISEANLCEEKDSWGHGMLAGLRGEQRPNERSRKASLPLFLLPDDSVPVAYDGIVGYSEGPNGHGI